jgi:hypothetical protein
MTTITISKPADIRMPRAAPVAAGLYLRFLELCERTLSTKASAKKEQDRAGDAQYVRRIADSVRSIDPRYAADLYAAADRHEL